MNAIDAAAMFKCIEETVNRNALTEIDEVRVCMEFDLFVIL